MNIQEPVLGNNWLLSVKRLKTMKQAERASVMRIVSDMVKADAIIDLQEIEFLNSVRQKYGISRDDELLSETTTLQDAFQVLTDASDSLRQDILGDLRGMALSDNACSREEAMLLLAATTCLMEDDAERVRVFSVCMPPKILVDSSQVLYVEGEFYKQTNREIVDHYREIVNELRLIGLNFVYCPKISEHYRSLLQEELNTLVTFLYPSIGEEQLLLLCKQLSTISTSGFCKEEIVGKMNMGDMLHCLPSLMFHIGQSNVTGKTYDNFLVIPVDDEATVVVQRIVDSFVQMFKPRILNPVYEERDRFVYNGFHKQIFDSIVYRKGIRSSVVVDIIHGEIHLPEASVTLKGLHRREKALYTLFLLESSSGGINFAKPTGAKLLARYTHRMDAIQEKYNIIYENFGGERDSAPMIVVSENRLPMISLIKRSFRKLGDLLNQPDDYLVQRNMFGNYCVNLPPELCKCLDTSTGKVIDFEESPFWRKILAM